MKRMDLFCASPASTAICSSIDHRSMIRRGHRPVDHHHHYHHHHHHHRHNHKPYAPCSSQLPIIPKPYNINNLDNQKSTGNSSADHISSPHGSSRYLLSDRPFIDWVSESDDHHRAPALVRSVSAKPKLVSSYDSPSLRSSSSKSPDKVVVLRVSIHCKGCEGKLRKHISKMEGVTSFSIDLATKKVTIIGDVTPLGVLASVSRVKNAQFWPSSSSSPPPPPPPLPVIDMISY